MICDTSLMARLARIIAPSLPYHVTQRGNRRAQIFFTEDDYLTYLSRLQADCAGSNSGTDYVIP